MPLPTDSTHLSDQDRTDMIEQYGGAVDSQFAKSSIMRKMVTVKPVRGTDTLINRRIGKTQLQALTPGVRPEPVAPTRFGRASVTVDTVIIARDNRSLLNEFQIDFNAREEIGKDHGKEQAKFFDQAFLIQNIKSSYLPAPANLNGSIGAGKIENLALAGDELDPDLLYRAMVRAMLRMQEEDIDTEEGAWFLRPTHHEVLLNNDKLVNRDFSPDNGNFSLGELKSLMGSPLISTARFPNSAITGHRLSNAENGNAYDVTAAQANAVATFMFPDSLLAGETIPLTSDVYYEKPELQWFIDSYCSFGVSNRRPDLCATVNKV
jgi:hypothetical protein